MLGDERRRHHLLSARGRASRRSRRHDQVSLEHRRVAVVLEQREKSLAHRKVGDRVLDIEIGLWSNGPAIAFTVFCSPGEGAQGVLHLIAELSQDGVGDVDWVLRREVDAASLAADEPHRLLDLCEQRRRRALEEQVRLVEEEHQLGLGRSARPGQALEESTERPRQERRVDLRREHAPVGREDAHVAATTGIGLHEVEEIQGGLAEEPPAALFLEGDEGALDGVHRGAGDMAVSCPCRWRRPRARAGSPCGAGGEGWRFPSRPACPRSSRSWGDSPLRCLADQFRLPAAITKRWNSGVILESALGLVGRDRSPAASAVSISPRSSSGSRILCRSVTPSSVDLGGLPRSIARWCRRACRSPARRRSSSLRRTEAVVRASRHAALQPRVDCAAIGVRRVRWREVSLEEGEVEPTLAARGKQSSAARRGVKGPTIPAQHPAALQATAQQAQARDIAIVKALVDERTTSDGRPNSASRLGRVRRAPERSPSVFVAGMGEAAAVARR